MRPPRLPHVTWFKCTELAIRCKEKPSWKRISSESNRITVRKENVILMHSRISKRTTTGVIIRVIFLKYSPSHITQDSLIHFQQLRTFHSSDYWIKIWYIYNSPLKSVEYSRLLFKPYLVWSPFSVSRKTCTLSEQRHSYLGWEESTDGRETRTCHKKK